MPGWRRPRRTALLVAVVVGGAASPAQAVTAEDAVLDWNRYASRRSSTHLPRRRRGWGRADRRNPAPRDRAGRGVRRRQHDRRLVASRTWTTCRERPRRRPRRRGRDRGAPRARRHGRPAGFDAGDRRSPEQAVCRDARRHRMAPRRRQGSRPARRPPQMLSERAADGRYGQFRFTCEDDPGEWRPTTSLVCTTPSGRATKACWRVPGGWSPSCSRAPRSSGRRAPTT